jgi:hypothetical protein
MARGSSRASAPSSAHASSSVKGAGLMSEAAAAAALRSGRRKSVPLKVP